MLKILWLANIPSPYRVDFFNELGKSCDLTVLFEKKGSDERDSSWLNYKIENFKAVFLKGKTVGVAEAICPSVVKWLKNSYDHIIVTNFSDPTGMIAITWLKIHRKDYEIESDGAFPGRGKGLKEMVKKFYISGAQRYFSTADLHDQYYQMYGAEKNKIVRYPFTSLSENSILDEPVSNEKKTDIRMKLGMKEKNIVLAVGQFIYRKGYDVLIKASVKLKDTGVYIVGGKEPKEYIDLVKMMGADKVHFIDFKKKSELEEYYLASDIFVHPTREDIWGLVINEAMSKGLPIVTTDKCIAGLTMITPGKNGVIVPIDSPELLAKGIEECLRFRHVYSKNALEEVKYFTLRNMVDIHLKEWREE